jgi:hypothetical protein
MKRSIYVTVQLILFLPIGGWAQSASEKPRESGNAAMKYWQAIALLPNFDEKQEKMLENWKVIPLDAEANNLLQTSQAMMKYMRRASACTHCYWDLEYNEGPMLLLPHLAKCRTLGRLAALQIRSEFEAGKPASAVDTFLTLVTLARHAGSEPIIISILVGYAIESFALEAISPYLPDLDKVLVGKLASSMANLPKMVPMQETLHTEKVYMLGWLIKQMEAAEKEQPGNWHKTLSSLLGPESEKEKNNNLKLLNSIESYAKARQLASDLMLVYDEFAKVFSLPAAQRDGRCEELLQQARKNNPLAVMLLPALTKTIASENRYQARLALFQAALEVVQKGPEQLKTIPDPFGNSPFEYKQLTHGFELTSKLHSSDGKQVSYSVGK